MNSSIFAAYDRSTRRLTTVNYQPGTVFVNPMHRARAPQFVGIGEFADLY
jgi:hypothetical protein